MEMETINKSKEVLLGQMTLVQSLIEHDGGSLLFLCKNDEGQFLFKWSDCDQINSRWLVFETNEAEVNSFLDGSSSLLSIIKDKDVLYFTDNDNEIGFNNSIYYQVDFNEIPSDYLPSENSYYKE